MNLIELFHFRSFSIIRDLHLSAVQILLANVLHLYMDRWDMCQLRYFEPHDDKSVNKITHPVEKLSIKISYLSITYNVCKNQCVSPWDQLILFYVGSIRRWNYAWARNAY